MWKKRSSGVRDQGIKAGLVFGSRCPYPEGSEEARQWELGWAEGVLRRTSPNSGGGTSGNYRDDEPAGQRQQAAPWQQFVRRVLGS